MKMTERRQRGEPGRNSDELENKTLRSFFSGTE